MKEHPILFSCAMVRAILAGRKTQTRRFVKSRTEIAGELRVGDLSKSPYGQIGDRLWVREAFSFLESDVVQAYWYWADGNPECGNWTKPKPSIHMPRIASRITLEIVSVRVEQLQDISEADAIAEGCRSKNDFAGLWNGINGDGSWESNPRVWAIEFKRVAA